MKNKTIISLLVLILFSFTILCGYSFNSKTEKQENKAKLFNQEKFMDDTATQGKQKAIELIKCVYEIKEGIYFPEVDDTCIINGKKCFVVFIYAKNELTSTTMEIFAVDNKSNIIYLLNRISGKYEKFAVIKYKDEIDRYLNTIMSSPKESSNIGDYIKKHRKEYTAVIALGAETLPYLKSIWDNGDHGLRGALALALCKAINPNLNIISRTSPDSRFQIETFGIDVSITAAGLFPAKGIRLIENRSRKNLWEMLPGYYETKFLWSNDSRYVAIYYAARTYGETEIFDTKEMKLIRVPGIALVKEKSSRKLTEQKNRPDPYFIVKEWLNNKEIKVDFSWAGENDINYSGYYVYNIVSKEMSKLTFK